MNNMKMKTNAEACRALDTLTCDCGLTDADVVTAIKKYLTTESLIDFVEYLEKEFDIDLEQYR